MLKNPTLHSMEEIQLRKLDDTEENQRLVRQFDIKLCEYESTIEPKIVSPEKADYKTNLHDERCYCIVAERGSEPVGYCYATVKKWKDCYEGDVYGYISTIFVEENYRRNKIGERMILDVKKWFENQGIQHVRLRTLAGNSSVAFYAKMGFKPYVIDFIRE